MNTKPVKKKINPIKTKEYLRGIVAEKQIISELGLRPSARYENIHLDIDAYDRGISISIKCQHMALKTGNFSFEVEVLNSYSGNWEDGNFKKCEAELYYILVGNTLYKFNKQDLSEKVFSGKYPERTLSAATVAKQKEIGHCHINSLSVLIPVLELKEIALEAVQMLQVEVQQ